MIHLTRLAVAKRSVTLLLAAGLFAAGIFAWGNLQQELLPNVSLPIITVVTPLPGAGANDVTEQVTKPIERAIGNVARLQQLSSTSSNSVSIVVAQFTFGTNVKDTQATIEQDLQAIGLPAGSTPQVTALDINAQPVITAAIQPVGSTNQEQLLAFAQVTIQPAIQGVEGVTAADLTGGTEQRVLVLLDPAKLAASGISVTQVQSVLQANNLTLPAGQLSQDGTSIPVSAVHSFGSLDEIAHLVVGVRTASPGAATGAPQPSGAPVAARPIPVTIGDLGSVQVVGVQATGYARLNGQPSITLTVSKSSDANTVAVADAVQSKLDALNAQYASSFHVTTLLDLSSYIKESRDGLVREGGLGAAFAIITIFLFLFSLRSTLVAAVSIPLSIMSALALMLVAGVSINIMTLGGLAVAVGRVVDDGIVVLENIYRHRGRGDTMREAVVSGTREVASAITSSTLTTVAVFLPLGFVGGIVSQFFLPFALTVTFALLSSLVVALTVVPVLASLFIDRVSLPHDREGHARDTIWQRLYTPTLRLALRNRWTRWGVLAIAALLVAGAGALLPHIPTQFLNSGSEKYLQVAVSPPSGTSSSAVLARAQQAESVLQADPEVQLIETTVPNAGDTGAQGLSAAFTGRASNSASILVRLAPSTDLNAEQEKLLRQLKPLEVGGYRVDVVQQNFGGGSTMSLIVSGSDLAAVRSGSQAVLGLLQATPNLANVRSDLSIEAPEVQVLVDPNRALAAGLTTAQVAGEIRAALVPQQVTRVQLGGGQPLDLYLQVNPAALTSPQALGQLPVGTATKVPLAAVSTIEQVQTQARVTRVDQTTAATLSADITSQDQGAVSRAVQQGLDRLQAGGKLSGVSVQISGVTQQTNEAFGGLFASMAVAVLLVYVVMVLVFDSLVDPLVILFSLPLATIGAFPALFLTHRPIGVSALIGFLMLIGIVVTNAIVLLDLVEQLRRRGLSTQEALIEGGRTRVRPILMTAIATILALTPLGLGLNEGSIIASELATVVIGGLFSSTFLTLVVVPVVYSLVEGGKDSVDGWRARRAEKAAAGEARA